MFTNTITARRSLAAWGIAATLLVTGSSAALSAPATPEQAAPQTVIAPRAQGKAGDHMPQAKAAANYLKTQLKPTAATGDHFEVPDMKGVVGPNVDVTVDGLLAFHATGNTTERNRLGAWLNNQANVKGAVYTTLPDGTTAVNPGVVAKLILAAVHTGQNPRSFAGYNLVALLEASQVADGTFSSGGKVFAGTYSQALSVLALSKANPGSAKLSAGASVLRGAACPDKTVSWGLGGQKCTANDQTDPDGTSLTLQALNAFQAAQPRDPKVEETRTMMTSGATALAGKQVARDSTGTAALAGQAWVNTCKPNDWTNKFFSANSTALSIQGIQAAAASTDTVSTAARTDGLAWMDAVAAANKDKAFPACFQSGPADVRATVQAVQALAQFTL